MTNNKVPPSLPVELWIAILEINQTNPIELNKLTRIKVRANLKAEENPKGVIAKSIHVDKKDRLSNQDIVEPEPPNIRMNDAFLNSFKAAVRSNSLMKKYTPEGIDEIFLLRAFNQRIAITDPPTRKRIFANYSGIKAPYPDRIDDFDLAMSYATTIPYKRNKDIDESWLGKSSDHIKADKKIMLEAIKVDRIFLDYASEELRSDKEFMMFAVGKNGWALAFASEELRNDKEVVMAAVKNDGIALLYTSAELCHDKEVVMAAVKSYGDALEYASADLRHDKEVVMAAVRNNGSSLRFASAKLRNDKKFMMDAKKIIDAQAS